MNDLPMSTRVLVFLVFLVIFCVLVYRASSKRL
jgi:hypothetical protein